MATDSESPLHSTFIRAILLPPEMFTRPRQDVNDSLFVLRPWCNAIRVRTPPEFHMFQCVNLRHRKTLEQLMWLWKRLLAFSDRNMILSLLYRINSNMTSSTEPDPFTFLIQSIFLVFMAFLSLCSLPALQGSNALFRKGLSPLLGVYLTFQVVAM